MYSSIQIMKLNILEGDKLKLLEFSNFTLTQTSWVFVMNEFHS